MPRPFQGAIFDVDGVLVDSPHEKAWRESLRELMESAGADIRDRTSWSPEALKSQVYQKQLSGKPRMSGARAALEHFGVPDLDARTIEYGDRKQTMVVRLIEAGEFTAYPDALRFIIAVKDAGLRVAAASSSKNAGLFLRTIRLDTFAAEHGLTVAAYYVENESGAKLSRPELFRLLSDAKPGDVLLTEQVDRLSRLTARDWDKLKAELTARHVRVVALDLPTSWMMATPKVDDFTARMFDAINGMMLDMLAAVARKDYEDRLRRQQQGQEKARAQGRYQGRPEDTKRNATIAHMLERGMSWSQIQDATGCSRATVAKIAARVKETA